MAKPTSLKTCSFCSREVYKLANPSRGLCAACYYREKKNGQLEYKPERTRKICSAEDCENLSISQGLCGKHLKRLLRHGTIEGPRFERWGHVEKHPLANVYYHMRRYDPRQVHEVWLKDFWAFVDDVGERPTPEHRFTRIDTSKPYQPGNVQWQSRALDLPTRTRNDRRLYAQAYRAANPDLYKDQHLRKKYGLSLVWYREKMAEQGGVCAICREAETVLNPHIGVPWDLCVDHCHGKGHARGLLCQKCNRGLGFMRDNPALLRAAALYLEQHVV